MTEEFDKEKYVDILRSTTWTLVDFSEVDTAVEQITRIVGEAYDVCLPRLTKDNEDGLLISDIEVTSDKVQRAIRWPVLPIFARVCEDWNKVLRMRAPLCDSTFKQFVLSADSSATGGGIRESLINNKLLSKYSKWKRRKNKLKDLHENRCREHSSNTNTDSMSLTSSELEVVHDDFLELGDYSHLNGHSTDPLQNPWRPVNFDDAGGQPANGPNQQVRQPAEQPVQPENQQGNLEQQLRAVAEALLQRVDDGTIAHNELVQDAQAEYQHEVGLAQGGADGGENVNGAINEARLHLLEVQNSATQETFSEIIREMNLSDSAANSLRVIAEAIGRSICQ